MIHASNASSAASQRLHLAQIAAAIRIATPQLRALMLLPAAPRVCSGLTAADRQAVPRSSSRVPELVGLREQQTRIEREEVDRQPVPGDQVDERRSLRCRSSSQRSGAGAKRSAAQRRMSAADDVFELLCGSIQLVPRNDRPHPRVRGEHGALSRHSRRAAPRAPCGRPRWPPRRSAPARQPRQPLGRARPADG